MAGWLAPLYLATIEPMAGMWRARGLVRPSASRLAVWKTVLGSWLLWRESTLRISVNWSIMAACLGRCSQTMQPGIRVRITEKGPRFSGGRLGLGSQVSMWLGPPAIHNRMTL